MFKPRARQQHFARMQDTPVDAMQGLSLSSFPEPRASPFPVECHLGEEPAGLAASWCGTQGILISVPGRGLGPTRTDRVLRLVRVRDLRGQG